MKELDEMKKAFDNVTNSAMQMNEIIKKLTKDNEKLKELCDKYENEHQTVFKEWLEDKQKMLEFENWLNVAIEIYNNVDLETLILVKNKLQELRSDNNERKI